MPPATAEASKRKNNETQKEKKKSITPQREPFRKERKQTYMNQNDNLKTFKKITSWN